jgi:uncharacterized protein YdaU (DUF1376 family)
LNYYKRHLGDYARDCGHLSVTEHGVFTLLLDRYYATERPLTTAEAVKICRASSKLERQAVDSILREFFALEDAGWRNLRADAEIAAYHERADRNREQGRRGGRPSVKPITQTVSSELLPPEPKRNPSHKPLAISQETSTVPSEPAPAVAADPIWGTGLAYLNRNGVATAQARPFLGKLRKEAGDVQTIALLADAEAQGISDPIPWLSAGARNAAARKAKPSAADDFRGKSYESTPDDQLPESLR